MYMCTMSKQDLVFPYNTKRLNCTMTNFCCKGPDRKYVSLCGPRFFFFFFPFCTTLLKCEKHPQLKGHIKIQAQFGLQAIVCLPQSQRITSTPSSYAGCSRLLSVAADSYCPCPGSSHPFTKLFKCKFHCYPLPQEVQ